MECKKIKSLLSEYLDKTLENDLKKSVKDHLLLCKNCSNEYFLIKTVVSKITSLEKVKAPTYLLNRVNQAIQSPSWLKRLLDFIPGSGGFKLPMEFVTLATTIALLFLIFSNIHVDKHDNTMVADTDSQSNTGTITGGTHPVQLDLFFKDKQNSKTLSSKNIVTVGRGASNRSNSSSLFDRIGEGGYSRRQRKSIQDINEIILLTGGDIISREYQPGTRHINAITLKIPSDTYSSFLNKVKKVGRFHPPAPSLPDSSTDPVLLHIKLNLPE